MDAINPFKDIPPDKEDDTRFLLERVYYALIRKLEIQENIFKAKISQQESKGKEMNERLAHLENCPCAVHRDPSHSCIVLDMRGDLQEIKASIDQKATKEDLAEIKASMHQKVTPLKIRLAWIGGGIATFAFLSDMILRLWLIFRGLHG